jgi:hypothetical protein
LIILLFLSLVGCDGKEEAPPVPPISSGATAGNPWPKAVDEYDGVPAQVATAMRSHIDNMYVKGYSGKREIWVEVVSSVDKQVFFFLANPRIRVEPGAVTSVDGLNKVSWKGYLIVESDGYQSRYVEPKTSEIKGEYEWLEWREPHFYFSLKDGTVFQENKAEKSHDFSFDRIKEMVNFKD